VHLLVPFLAAGAGGGGGLVNFANMGTTAQGLASQGNIAGAPFVLDLSPPELEVFAKGSDADKAITAAALRYHPHEAPAAIFDAVGERRAAADWRAYRERMQRRRPVISGECAVADSDFALT
jgi:hypothetical protein